MDRSKLTLRKKPSNKNNMSNTESDLELGNMNDEIPSGQRITIPQIIPINFNIGNLDEVFENDTDCQEINNCVRKINEMLSRRHNTATLTRDLRRFKGDELPDYARLPKASFNPQLGSSETELYFRSKIQEFNKTIRTNFRETMLQAATEHSEKMQTNSEQIWREACTKIKNGKNITKLNNQVQEIKEKWAEKYREAALKAITKEELKNDRGDVQKLKHEIDQIKRKPQREEETELVKFRREMDELKNSMRDNRKKQQKQ
ncbi:Hypothetical predicted protein [Mytilus galloprovincialis]|uniref:Uncharacterized protein n=1 Tax=Mytilus galloprovincialis TaxID=29158 RepID=A0A8B6D621_MYTGA|nr:Hypothetical predicted protein [Mytilus galloprovincialis]